VILVIRCVLRGFAWRCLFHSGARGVRQHPAGSPAWWAMLGSNQRPPPCQGGALPLRQSPSELGKPLLSTRSGHSRDPSQYPNQCPAMKFFRNWPLTCCGLPPARYGVNEALPLSEPPARRRRESNPCTGLCRPLPKPLGHSANPRLPVWDPWRGKPTENRSGPATLQNGIRRLRADDGIRTRDPHLGKVMRYQLRYVRMPGQSRAGALPPGRACDQNCSRS
jgi:hypothetical protein